MKHLLEFLSVKNAKPIQYDTVEDELSINSELIQKYKFKSRTLRTGNIELITLDYKTKNDDLLGQRFVFYIKSNPMCLRRQPWVKTWTGPDWDNHARKIGEFKTVDEMCRFFERYVEKKLIK